MSELIEVKFEDLGADDRNSYRDTFEDAASIGATSSRVARLAGLPPPGYKIIRDVVAKLLPRRRLVRIAGRTKNGYPYDVVSTLASVERSGVSQVHQMLLQQKVWDGLVAGANMTDQVFLRCKWLEIPYIGKLLRCSRRGVEYTRGNLMYPVRIEIKKMNTQKQVRIPFFNEISVISISGENGHENQ